MSKNQAEALSNNYYFNGNTVRNNKSIKHTNHVKPRLMAIELDSELTQEENQADLSRLTKCMFKIMQSGNQIELLSNKAYLTRLVAILKRCELMQCGNHAKHLKRSRNF